MGISNLKLSILIATIGRRNDKFLRLIEELAKQTTDQPIEIIVFWNNGEYKIGEIRQKLLEEARGEYVCFVDDDDWMPSYYVNEILQNLGKDYVGFEVELFNEDTLMPRAFHSIKYGVWHQDEGGYYRGVTHLNPIKRDIALQASFGMFGIGEDETWARMVTPLVRSENYINRIMYYYHHDRFDTAFGGDVKPMGIKYSRPELHYDNVKYHSESKETGVY